MTVMEQTNEGLPNFTVSCGNDLIVLQASESNESQRNRQIALGEL